MSLMDKIFEQGRKPTGFWGNVIGRLMNLAHRPFYRLLSEQVPIEPDFTILDIGCGAGRSLAVLAEKVPCGKVFGIDYSPEMVRMASKVNEQLVSQNRIEVIQTSVSSMPFEDSLFDLVVASETIHFWPDLSNDLREVYRVIKPSGHLVIVNKYARDEKEAAKLEKYFSLHSPADFRKALEDAGFLIERLELLQKQGQIIIVGQKTV